MVADEKEEVKRAKSLLNDIYERNYENIIKTAYYLTEGNREYMDQSIHDAYIAMLNPRYIPNWINLHENQIIAYFRMAIRTSFLNQVIRDGKFRERNSIEVDPLIFSETFSPERIAEDNEERMVLGEVIYSMSKEEKELIRQRFYLERTYAQIAEKVEKSEKTVGAKVRLLKAKLKSKMRRRLTQEP